MAKKPLHPRTFRASNADLLSGAVVRFSNEHYLFNQNQHFDREDIVSGKIVYNRAAKHRNFYELWFKGSLVASVRTFSSLNYRYNQLRIHNHLNVDDIED